MEWPPNIVDIPDDGLLMSAALARALGVGIGDAVDVEVLEGDRRVRSVRIAALANEMFGLLAYMSFPALESLLGADRTFSSVLLSIDRNYADDIDARLKRMPRVAAVGKRREAIAKFRNQSAETMNTMTMILTLFGCAIAVAVVYNNARIALSMRSRDLASLRVLGFTRREISTILLGELGAYVVLAIVPGLLMGKGLVVMMMSTMDQEMYRMPIVVTAEAYAFATLVTLGAAIASAAIVRRQLDHLDLVAVLKARE
jgi:putative ABC transport system permease protein